jgi:competence protein ComEC
VLCWLLVGSLLLGGLISSRRSTFGRRALALGLVLLAGGLAVAAVGREARRSGPVADLARRAGVGHVELTLSGDPRPLPAIPHVPPSVLVEAKIRELDVGGRRWTLGQPVLVLAPAASWSRLLPSTRVAASVNFRLPEGSDVAALVITHSKPTVIRGPTALQRWAGRLRAGLRRAAAGLPEAERGLLPGLVVGDVSEMPDSVTADFRAAGLTHLTAVSGANLAVVVAAVFWLLRWTPLGIRMRALSSATVLLGFVVLARPSPSVVRAAAMGLLALAAIGLGRPRALLPGLLGTVTALALFDPVLASRPGFALSVLATLALLVLAPGWVEPIRRWLPERSEDSRRLSQRRWRPRRRARRSSRPSAARSALLPCRPTCWRCRRSRSRPSSGCSRQSCRSRLRLWRRCCVRPLGCRAVGSSRLRKTRLICQPPTSSLHLERGAC